MSEIREKRKGVEARYLVEKKNGQSKGEKVKFSLLLFLVFQLSISIFSKTL